LVLLLLVSANEEPSAAQLLPRTAEDAAAAAAAGAVAVLVVIFHAGKRLPVGIIKFCMQRTKLKGREEIGQVVDKRHIKLCSVLTAPRGFLNVLF
jgi:hypothetical protein